MDKETSTGAFALGIIVTALLFLFVHRMFRKGCGCSSGKTSSDHSANLASVNAVSSGCCCSGDKSNAPQVLPSNPGISIGGQSYNGSESFGSSSVN